MKFRFFLAASVLSFSSGAQGQIRAVRPPHTAAANEELGSSGIDAGDYVYVSGQGPLLVDGGTPANFADQVRQSLDNIKRDRKSTRLNSSHTVISYAVFCLKKKKKKKKKHNHKIIN